MNDGNLSRSQRRRQRRKNRKLNDNQCDKPEINPPDEDEADKGDKLAETKIEIKYEYRVDSPGELAKKKKKKLSQNPIKSKSLDDDDTIKIQELSEASETEDRESNAIVCEVLDSDVDCDDVSTTQSPKTNSLTVTDLYNTHQNSLMSPEEEETLRNFLDTLNLVNGPEEAAKQVLERGSENPKAKKLQKRAALEEYFLPMCQNPRYLDVISEEASDKDSDREEHNLTKHLKRGTPELEVENKPPEVPPRNRDRKRVFPKRFSVPVEQPPPVLVDTKILEDPRISEDICRTRTAEASSSVEIVYLDSSESNSPGEVDTTSNESFALDSTKGSNEEISKREFVNGVSSSETDIQDSGSSIEDLNKDETKVIDHGSGESSDTSAQNVDIAQNGMVTCKRDNLAQECKTYEELSGENETETTSSSTKYSFVVKTKETPSEVEERQRFLVNGIISQLTPPPTPESLSPKSGVDSSVNNTVLEDKDNKNTCNGDVAKTKETETYKIQENRRNDNNTNLNGTQESCHVPKLRPNAFGSTILIDKEDKNTDHIESYRKFTSTPNLNINEKGFPENYKRFEQKVEGFSKREDKSNSESLPSPSRAYKKFPGSTDTENLLIVKEGADIYTNALSPPPPSRSPSVSSSSSRDSSLCTAKYNPLSSSLADVTSISKEEEQSKQKPLYQPPTLREICLKFLITLPFGTDILQELADVSLSIESFTNSLPSKILPKLLPAFVDTQSSPTNDSSDLSVGMKTNKGWVGIPTERDPRVLVCLSPKQKEELERSKTTPDEAGKLLELHEKFVNRRSCQEDVKKEVEEKVIVTNVSRGSSSVNVLSPTGNRLLGVIKEEGGVSEEGENYLYFVEKDPKKGSATLPRSTSNDDARLKAKNLAEWLNLARNKSMSESNLHTVADIPENNLRKDFAATPTPAPRRRTSLPYDLYERQMIYLQEKEREIQRQLEQLEEEKRKISAEMASSREFQLEDYRFSRRGDFAENKNPTPRLTSMPAMPTEIFRQQMYEEYLDKFAEREERKQQKVIKVTSSKDVSEDTEKSKEVVHPVLLENEFLEKVKQKQLEGKLGKSRDSVGKEGSLDKEREDDEPVLVMDGERLKGTKQLPRHLQEFVSITKDVAQSTDPDGES